MPAKRRLTMRQLRQMLRLAGSGTSSREIAVILGVARSTVQDCVPACKNLHAETQQGGPGDGACAGFCEDRPAYREAHGL